MYRSISRTIYDWIRQQSKEEVSNATLMLDKLQVKLTFMTGDDGKKKALATATLSSYEEIILGFDLNDQKTQKEFSDKVNDLFYQNFKDDFDFMMESYLTESLHASADGDGKHFKIVLSNGKSFSVEREAISEGSDVVWDWKIDTQYFNDGNYARTYLDRLIAEKLTGKRVIYREKKPVPEICGIEGAACRSPGKCNTMLCSNCPVAENFFADRDGVELVYAI